MGEADTSRNCLFHVFCLNKEFFSNYFGQCLEWFHRLQIRLLHLLGPCIYTRLFLDFWSLMSLYILNFTIFLQFIIYNFTIFTSGLIFTNTEINKISFYIEAFTTINTYNIHLKEFHKVEKVHLSCPECSYMTYQKVNLDRHIKIIHRKEKDLQCPKCSFQSSKQCDLKRHLREVHQ